MMHSIHGEIAQTILGPCGTPSFFCSSALLIFAHTKSIHMFMTWNQTIYFRGFIILAGMPSFSCQFPTNHQEKSIFLLKTIQFLEHVLSNEHEHLQASNCCLVFLSHKLSISAPITVPCTQCASEEIESIMQSLAKLKAEGISCSLITQYFSNWQRYLTSKKMLLSCSSIPTIFWSA